MVRCHGQVGRLRAREFRVGRGPVVAVPTTHHATRREQENVADRHEVIVAGSLIVGESGDVVQPRIIRIHELKNPTVNTIVANVTWP